MFQALQQCARPTFLFLLLNDNSAVCLRFFNADGQPVITELDRRVIGIPLEQLRRVERTVGIAGGSRKHVAIRGALRGQWVNVLITDRFTAYTLLDEAG